MDEPTAPETNKGKEKSLEETIAKLKSCELSDEPTLKDSDGEPKQEDVDEVLKNIPHQGGPCRLLLKRVFYAIQVIVALSRDTNAPVELVLLMPGGLTQEHIPLHNDMSFNYYRIGEFFKVVVRNVVDVLEYEICTSPFPWAQIKTIPMLFFSYTVDPYGKKRCEQKLLEPNFSFSVIPKEESSQESAE